MRGEFEPSKVVFVGPSGVGKTAIIGAILGRPFVPNNSMTVAGGAYEISVPYQGSAVPLLIWDTAGQEKYRTIVPIYFKSAEVIVVVYDISERESFDSLSEWLELSASYAPGAARAVFVGNKKDRADRRAVDAADGERRAAELAAANFRETSALTGEGIAELLETIAETVVTARTRNDHICAPACEPGPLEPNERLRHRADCC
jgi:small GTP-binding protein